MQKANVPRCVFVLLVSSLSSYAQQDLSEIISSAGIPGIQLLYARESNFKTYSLGVVESDSYRKVDSNTIFQAASLSKPVFAYAVLRLHDKGIIHIDTPLLCYKNYQRFDNANPAFAKITARMVLRHTTGLPNWGANPSSFGWEKSPLYLRFKPDSCFSYSGEGFAFLQRVVEDVTNKPLNELMQDEVFTPLKMSNSSYLWKKMFNTNAAIGHNSKGKPTGLKKYNRENAAFSLLTTAYDYTLFLQSLMTGTGLKPETAKMMMEVQSPANRFKKPPHRSDDYIDWGLGVGLEQNARGKALWHWGDNGNFKCFFMAFPESKESFVYFTNSANGLKIADDMLNHFFGKAPYWAVSWLNY